MADTALESAVGRLERAIARVERASADPRPNPAVATSLEARHERLRERVTSAIEQLDALIDPAGDGR